MSEIRELQKEISEWADKLFPDRTSWDATTKLVLREIPEWLNAQDDPLEYADLIILILDIGTLNGIDVAQAVKDKMEINRNRKWKIDPETRTMQHVEEDVSPQWPVGGDFHDDKPDD